MNATIKTSAELNKISERNRHIEAELAELANERKQLEHSNQINRERTQELRKQYQNNLDKYVDIHKKL